MKNLSKLTVTQLLVKAELDDPQNRDQYLEEVKSRNPTESEIDKAHKAVEFIRNSRLERETKPLSIALKVLLIVFPFIIYNRYYFSHMEDTMSNWDLKGYKKKRKEFWVYSGIGFSFYIFLFVYFLVIPNNFEKSRSGFHDLGRDLNPRRDSLGIALIPSDWYTKDNNYYESTWSDFKHHSKPHHKEKVVYPRREIDRFVNPISDSERFMLEISYNYGFNSEYEIPWSCYLVYESDVDEYIYETTEVSKQEADSVLRSWNL